MTRFRRPRGRLRRFALYGASRMLVDGLLSVRGIVLAGVLGPVQFGVWALFRLALQYGAFAALGIHRGVEVEVAAAEDQTGRRPWGRATTGFLLAVFGVLGALALGLSFGVTSPARETLWAVAVGLLVQRLWVYGRSYLRADGHLRRFAVVELTRAASSLVLTCLFALRWGLLGAYTGFVAATVAGIVLLGRSVPFRPEVAGPRVRRLLDVGVPLSFAAVANTVLSTVDRLIVAGMEGTEVLGFYAFAVAASGLGASAAWAVRTVVFPDVYAGARREGGEVAAETHLRDTVLPAAHVLPPLLGLAALALGPAIALVAPRYLEVLPVARVFIFTGVAAGIMHLGTLGVVATERQRLLPLLALGGLALNALTAFTALLGGLGLMGVAVGALVSRSLTGVGIACVSVTDARAGRLARLAIQLLWPLAWSAVAVSLIGWWRPGSGVATTAVSTLLYLATLIPLLPMLAREARRLDRS